MEVATLLSPPIIAALGGIVVVILLLMLRGGGAGKEEKAHTRKVREMVETGNYRAAGEMQLRKGNTREALNLFERGKQHDRAITAAIRLGDHATAAKHAEAAGDLEKAARMYAKAGDPRRAAKIYRRLGDFGQAIELLERLPDTTPLALAQLWESAYLDCFPAGGAKLDAAGMRKLQDTAIKAADAYKHAGDLKRAVHFYKAADRADPGKQSSFESDHRNIFASGDAGPSVPGELPPLLSGTRLGEAGTGAYEAVAGPDTEDIVRLSSGERVAVMTQLESGPHAQVGGGTPADVTAFAMSDDPLVSPAELLSDEFAAINDNPAISKEILASVVNQVLERVRDSGSAPAVDAPSTDRGVETPSEAAPAVVESKRYELLDKLGEGGMAAVFKARDKVLDRTVALKLLPPGIMANDGTLAQFEKEAKASAKLNHPNIITVHDFGVLDGRAFICMEFVDGVTLWEMIVRADERGMKVVHVLAVAEGLMRALDYAHRKGLVHRDIKPANIMWSREGGIKLMDFGIAGLMSSDRTTKISGTPIYMAPEQMAGKGIDHRTDLFSAGISLYEMLTGYVPFEGVLRDLPPLSAQVLRPSIPRQLSDLLMRCLSLEPTGRPESAAEMLEALSAMRRDAERADSQTEALARRPRLLEANEKQLNRVISQNCDPMDVPPKRIQVLFEAALEDPRPEIRLLAIERYPGKWEGAFMDHLLGLIQDPEARVREAAKVKMAS